MLKAHEIGWGVRGVGGKLGAGVRSAELLGSGDEIDVEGIWKD